MTKIIFVEGLQGCGKTTISEWLSHQIRTRGGESAWYREDAEHRLGMHYMPDKCADVAQYMKMSAVRWSAFASEHGEKDIITVLDGRLLMCPTWSLLRHNMEAEKIAAFVGGLAGAVAILAPMLVYLHAPDYRAVFAAMCQRRGQKTEDIYVRRHNETLYAQSRQALGYEGLVRFELEHKAIVEQLFDSLNMPKLDVDITGQEWDSYKQTIMQFVEPFLGNAIPARRVPPKNAIRRCMSRNGPQRAPPGGDALVP